MRGTDPRLGRSGLPVQGRSAREADRAHLRRRPGPALDAADRRRARSVCTCPATFFVVGSEVVRHPDLVRQLHRQGFELGNHTFTHADLSTLPGWEQQPADRADRQRARRDGRHPPAPRSGRPTRRFRAASPPTRRGAYETPRPRRLRHRAHRLRRRGLAPPGGRRDRRLGHAPGRRGAASSSSTTEAATARRRSRRRAARPCAPCPRLPLRDRLRARRPATRARRRSRSTAGAATAGAILIATLAVARWTTTILAWLLVAVALLFVARVFLLSSSPGAMRGPCAAATARTGSRRRSRSSSRRTTRRSGIERAVRSLAASDYPDSRSSSSTTARPTAPATSSRASACRSVRLIRQPNAGKPAALNHGIAEAAPRHRRHGRRRHRLRAATRSRTSSSRSPTRGRRGRGQREGRQPRRGCSAAGSTSST